MITKVKMTWALAVSKTLVIYKNDETMIINKYHYIKYYRISYVFDKVDMINPIFFLVVGTVINLSHPYCKYRFK